MAMPLRPVWRPIVRNTGALLGTTVVDKEANE